MIKALEWIREAYKAFKMDLKGKVEAWKAMEVEK